MADRELCHSTTYVPSLLLDSIETGNKRQGERVRRTGDGECRERGERESDRQRQRRQSKIIEQNKLRDFGFIIHILQF